MSQALRAPRCPSTYWDARASVRKKPMWRLTSYHSGLFFPLSLVPATEADVWDAEQLRARSAQALLDYLWFTCELEQHVVLPVTTAIASGRSGLGLTDVQKLGAFAITTDEAWHAQEAAVLMSDIQQQTSPAAEARPTPAFMSAVGRIRSTLPVACDLPFAIMTAVVSETLISAKLRDMPHALELPEGVRGFVRDHAEDEGRHHAYFRDVLPCLWTSLSKSERAMLGRQVPALIRTFLSGNDAESGAPASHRTAEPAHDGLDWALAAESTCRYFAEVGALDIPEVGDAFMAQGLPVAFA